MSNEDIDEAEKLLERATPGKAEAFTGMDGITRVHVDGCPYVVVVCDSDSVDGDRADAAAIVHLRNHAPAWLNELRALRKLRDAVDVYMDSGDFWDVHAVLAALREAKQEDQP